MVELKDELLEKVNGGAMDWKVFSQNFMSLIGSTTIELTIDHKKIVEAIKRKDYIEVATLVIPLIGKGDELVLRALMESK